MGKQKKKINVGKLVFSIFLSVLFGQIVLFGLSLVKNVFVKDYSAGNVIMAFAITYISTFIASMVTGYLTGVAFGKDRVIMSFVTGLVTIVIMLVVNLFTEQKPLDVLLIVRMILILSTTVAFAIFVVPKQKTSASVGKKRS